LQPVTETNFSDSLFTNHAGSPVSGLLSGVLLWGRHFAGASIPSSFDFRSINLTMPQRPFYAGIPLLDRDDHAIRGTSLLAGLLTQVSIAVSRIANA
jgi:hypothetical protein